MIWHSADINEVLKELDTNIELGLTSPEADNRRGIYGSNTLSDKSGKSFLDTVKSELKNPIFIGFILVAFFTLLMSIIDRDISPAAPIVLTVLAIIKIGVSLALTFLCEKETSLNSFSKNELRARVIRDAKRETILASELVPGDIIFLKPGDRIPADARLILADSLHSDESALLEDSASTEKSLFCRVEDFSPVEDRRNMVFFGCSVISGTATAVVTSTGFDTEFGKELKLSKITDERETAFSSKIQKFEKIFSQITIYSSLLLLFIRAVIALILGAHFLPVLTDSALLVSSIAVALASLGLSLNLTLDITATVLALSKRKTLLKNADALNSLSEISVICTDKTGVLTRNQMVLTRMFDGHTLINVSEETVEGSFVSVLRLASMCCNGNVHTVDGNEIHEGDPTQTALLSASMKYLGADKYELDNTFPRIHEIPFDSERKLMTTVNLIDGKPYVIVKGALEALIPCCSNIDSETVLKVEQEMSDDALRVVAVAIKPLQETVVDPTAEELECNLSFIGLFGLCDLIRNESQLTVKNCHDLGIRVVMITGDNKTLADAIASKLGILTDESQSMSGETLASLSDKELRECIDNYRVFSRISNADRVRIIRALKANGHTVSVTGDSISDAHSLMEADIGFAMGKHGKDIAKDYADVIISDDRFSTMCGSVFQARKLLNTVSKSVVFAFCSAASVFITALLAALISGPAAFSPALIILLSIISILICQSAVSASHFNPTDISDCKRNELFTKEFFNNVIVNGIPAALSILASYILSYILYTDTSISLGAAFTTTVFTNIFLSFVITVDNIELKEIKDINPLTLIPYLVSIVLFILVIATPLKGIFSIGGISFGTVISSILFSFIVPVIFTLRKLLNK